jgi:DNA-binding MarR family transcriptional regulator
VTPPLAGKSPGTGHLPDGNGGGGVTTAAGTGGLRDPVDPDDEALLDVARVVMDASVTAADRVGGISTVQLRALRVIRALAGANLARLAERLDVGMSTTSRLVDRLVAAGLVDRRPSPRTRREVTVTLSRRGDAVLDRYDALRLQELRRSVAAVEPGARAQLLSALRSWSDAVRATAAGGLAGSAA